MMDGWSDIVVDELNAAEGQLASAIGLQKGMSSEAFEEIVGAVFAWQSHLPEVERFIGVGGPQPGTQNDEMQRWLRDSKRRGNAFAEVLQRTLYATFRAGSVDESRAQRAYQQLLGVTLPGGAPSDTQRVVFATTNYDPSIEMALGGLGFTVATGRSESGYRTPALEPEGMVTRAGDGVIPVIHLHGAVGWYRRDGRILVHGAEMPYNPTLGQPALLMPDPDKDPSKDSGVEQLWIEFRQALKTATHVLVAGHSLHDVKLVTEVRNALDRGARVGVTYFASSDGAEDQSFIGDALEGAIPIRAKLGPNLFMDLNHVELWRSGAES
jgi:hypothetical protein